MANQNWIFRHPSFHFDGWNELENIKRKVPGSKKHISESNQNDGNAPSVTLPTSLLLPKSTSGYERHGSPSYNPGSDSDLGLSTSSTQSQLSALQSQLSTLQTQLASLAASNRTLSDQLRIVSETQASLVTECASLRRDLTAMGQNPPTNCSQLTTFSRTNESKTGIPLELNERSFYSEDFTSNTLSSISPSTSSSSSVAGLEFQKQPTEDTTQQGNVMMSSRTLQPLRVESIHSASTTNADLWSSLDTWIQGQAPGRTESDCSRLDNTLLTGLTPRPVSAGSSLLVGVSNAFLERSMSPTMPGWTVSPRVLLVDDDIVSRKLGSKVLQVCGCTIDVAVDGLGAVNKMNLEKYDLVLMDIMMPKLDGVSATSLIRKFDLFTPIISMTSNSTPGQIMSYYSSGMNDVLSKPVTKARLLEVLEKHLIHLRTIQQMSNLPLSMGVGVPVVTSPSVGSNLVQLLGKRRVDDDEPVESRKRAYLEVVE